MEKQLNLTLMEGRLTRNPELLQTSGGSVCKFDIAVNNSVKYGNEVRNTVDFFSITAWNRLGEICSKYLKKGAKVRIRGRLKHDTWTAKDGRKMSNVHIDAASVEFIGSKKRQDDNVAVSVSSKEENNPYQTEVNIPF
ncbi:MAG: single-stranded DNA-binding protein [Spirochaetales bacterium]|nr:single-stranded DNA-binding protein [Spirochaetales bacterium]